MQCIEICANGKELAKVYYQTFTTPIDREFIEIRQTIRHGRLEQCVLCLKPLTAGELVTNVTSNYALFPACFVHTACFTDVPRQVLQLAQDWDVAQQYAHWF